MDPILPQDGVGNGRVRWQVSQTYCGWMMSHWRPTCWTTSSCSTKNYDYRPRIQRQRPRPRESKRRTTKTNGSRSSCESERFPENGWNEPRRSSRPRPQLRDDVDDERCPSNGSRFGARPSPADGWASLASCLQRHGAMRLVHQQDERA